MTAEHIQVEGAPAHELMRSPATLVVGRLATESNLLLSHFEHRVALPLPEIWLPEGRTDLGEMPGWHSGVLPEAKYQSFSHDRISGSFHPGHRAKWTGHELCHGLVGFAWKAGASRFFHALAARLAEVLPVALWYFFDEAHLQRCEQHQGDGPLFRQFCPVCETAAARGPVSDDSDAAQWLDRGQAYVQRELDAVRQSMATGRMVPHRMATLDLASDALAYAAAHTERLNSEAFQRYMNRFAHTDRGHHPSLESLIARIETLTSAIVSDGPATAWTATRWDWAAQDVGWRLLQIWTETEGEAAEALEGMVDHLADNADPTGMAEAIQSYQNLCEAWELPEPVDVFAVGYDVTAGYGRSTPQIMVGLQSALPATHRLLGEHGTDVATLFVSQDAPQRTPLGRRFAAFLPGSAHDALTDVARFEAAIAHAQPADLEAITLAADVAIDGQTAWVRGPGGEVLSLAFDVPTLVEMLLRTHQIPEDAGDACALAVVSFADGDVGVLHLSEQAANVLDVTPSTPVAVDALDLAEVSLLVEHGLLVPARYSV